jgi:S1-C subfamily serine protease
MSALGLPNLTGVLVLEVPGNSALAQSGLQKNDVILSINGIKTADVLTLLKQAPVLNVGQTLAVGISRHQKETTLRITAGK